MWYKMLKFICFNLRFNTLNAIHVIIWILTISIVRFWVSVVLLRVINVKFVHTQGNELNRFREAQDTP